MGWLLLFVSPWAFGVVESMKHRAVLFIYACSKYIMVVDFNSLQASFAGLASHFNHNKVSVSPRVLLTESVRHQLQH